MAAVFFVEQAHTQRERGTVIAGGVDAAFSTDMIDNLISNSKAHTTGTASDEIDAFFNTPIIVNVVAEGVDNVGRTIKSNELSLPFYPTPQGYACVVCTYDEEEETASN